MVLSGNIYSESLSMRTGLTVFMPDKAPVQDAYRVVYLLHGLHGNHSMWLENTMLSVFAKDKDAVIVMPEVARSFYADMKHGYKYWTYISEELPGLCQRAFNITKRREHTAVIGCSMGGYGALKTALAKPDHYGFCGAIAPACVFFDEILATLHQKWETYVKSGPEAQALFNDMCNIFGEDLQCQPGDLILSLAKQSSTVRIYGACGLQDDLLSENRRLDEQMRKLSIDWTYEEWDGKHDWDFFNKALEKALNKFLLDKDEK